MEPLVSIVCLAYNHEKYIEKALDGFIMQKTNFPFEIVIHDDASTDNTTAIIRNYELKYPHLFRPIYQVENQFSKEKGKVTKTVFLAAQGKYVALCEGDDYWTDPLKLQKQFDLMEAYPEYVMCTHDYLIHYEHKNIPDKKATDIYNYLKSVPNSNADGYTFTVEDFSKNLDGLHTATNFIRTDIIKMIMPKITAQVVSGDYILKLFLLQYGNGLFLPDLMSVLRKNSGGVTQQKKDWLKQFNLQKEQLNYFASVAPASCKKYFYRRLWKIYPNYILGKKDYRKLVSLKDRLAAVVPFFNSLVKSI